MRAWLFAVSAIAIACCSGATAWSATPVGEAFDAQVWGKPATPPDLSEWAYTLGNSSSKPNYLVWLLQIAVDEETAVLDAESPEGWTVDLDEPHLVMWTSTSGDVPAGDILTGFRAHFDRRPESQSWTAMFSNTEVAGETPVDFGDVIVCEPGALIAVISGATSLAALVAKRRGRR